MTALDARSPESARADGLVERSGRVEVVWADTSDPVPVLVVVTGYGVAARADQWRAVTEVGLHLAVVDGDAATSAAALGDLVAEVLEDLTADARVSSVVGAGLGAEARPWVAADLDARVSAVILQQPEQLRAGSSVPTLVLGSWFCHTAELCVRFSDDPSITVVMGPWINPYQQRVADECRFAIADEEMVHPLVLAAQWLSRVGLATHERDASGVPGLPDYRTFVRGTYTWQSVPEPMIRSGVERSVELEPARHGARSAAVGSWIGPALVDYLLDDPAPGEDRAYDQDRAHEEQVRVLLEQVTADGRVLPVASGTGNGGCAGLPPVAFRLPPGDTLRVRTEPPTEVVGLTVGPELPMMVQRDPVLQSLVDERTGILTAVEPVEGWPGIPPGVHLWSGHVSDVDAVLGWPADRISLGMAFDPIDAWHGAVGEAVERYCGNAAASGVRTASWDQLAEAGERAVDPQSLALLSPEQYAEPGCPFVPFRRDLVVGWVRGVDLIDTQPTWVPASLVWVNHHLTATRPGVDPEEPLTHPVNLAGLAAGRTLADAERAACEEIIERDAAELWWHSGAPATAVVDAGVAGDFAGVVETAHLVDLGQGWWRRRCADAEWLVRVVAIPTVFDVSVIGVLLHDLRDDLYGLGLAARPDPAVAIGKALLESISLIGYARGLLEPDGDIWTAAEQGAFDGSALHAWRADRRYRDSYRDDFRDARDLSCHAQLWLDPQMHRHLAPLVRDLPTTTLKRLPRVGGDPRSAYVAALHGQDIRPVSVDITTDDIAAAATIGGAVRPGPRVCRIVAPGAYSNTPAAFPLLGGQRLMTNPVRLGLRESPLTRDDIVLAPMPHT